MKIDLSKLPEGAKWISIDSDGDVFCHCLEPLVRDGGYYCGLDELIGDRCIGNVHD